MSNPTRENPELYIDIGSKEDKLTDSIINTVLILIKS